MDMKYKGIDKVIIDEKELRKRVKQIAEQINHDYRGKDLVMVGVLKGSIYFIADLSRYISIPVNLDFLSIGRYNTSKATGIVKIERDLNISISGKHVLLIEDIINTGLTHGYLLKNLEPRNPASLHICTLLENTEKRLVDLPIKYRGFKINEVFVVGYGLDYEENYRHLPCIARYNPKK